jgi:hypothetical protein
MDTRFIAVPLPFTISVQKTARHKLADMTFYTMVDITVRSFENEEAPVAAHFSKYNAPDNMEHVRTTGDGFYRPVFFEPVEFNPLRRLPPVFMSEAVFLEKLSKADGQDYKLFPNDMSFTRVSYARGELTEFNPDHVFNYDEAALNKRIATMQEAASSLALIDGFLYQRSPEPHYKVKGPSGDCIDPDVDVVFAGQSKDKSVTNEFALSSFDDASDYAERMFGQPLRKSSAADVVIPSAFLLDRTKDAVLELLDKALSEHGPDLAFTDITTMMAWGYLRDATLRAERSNDPTTLDDVFGTYADQYSNAPQAKPRAVFFLNQARERWSLRPVQSFSERSIGLK